MHRRLIPALLFLSALVVAPIGDVHAQNAAVPQSAGEIRLSFAPVVKQAAPAVVNVYTTRNVDQRQTSPFFDDPFFRRFFGNRGFGMPRQRAERSLGSGVIIEASGIVVTNNHVIKGADAVRVVLADKREFDAEILLKDERTDLAVLKMQADGKTFPFLQFADSDALEVGDLVLAIGNPFGVGQTVTSGIVSALARTRVGVTDYQFFIQTDAAINPGNSGGALIDTKGQVVGINTAIFSRSGGSNGIGFAIPSNMVRLVARSAREGGRVLRPWLGASLQELTVDIAESLGLARPTGALVVKVREGSPADSAGLRTGDLILEIDGVEIEDPNGFGYRFATKGISGHTTLLINRRGRESKVRITLMAAPETPREEREIRGRSPFAGAIVSNLSPALAEEFGVTGVSEGAVVTELRRGSTAQRVGLRTGDVIVEVNGRAVGNTRDLAGISREQFYVWRIAISRNGRIVSMALGG